MKFDLLACRWLTLVQRTKWWHTLLIEDFTARFTTTQLTISVSKKEFYYAYTKQYYNKHASIILIVLSVRTLIAEHGYVILPMC